MVLVVVWFVFTLLYLLSAPEGPYFSPLILEPKTLIKRFWEVAVYSLGGLVRLNPDPKPSPGWFQFFVTLQGILGPLQIALFLLAVRRKVMR